MKNNKIENYILNILLFSFLASVLLISQKNYYGADHDTFAVIGSFINMIENGYYEPSRSFGNIFAELILGSLVFFLGSKPTSAIVAIIFLISILNFYLAFKNKESSNIEFKIFFLLCLSNPILLFDNLNIIDFVLALFFFSSGCLLFKKNNDMLGVLFFAFSIGCRLNFSLFAVTYIILNYKNNFLTIFKYLVLLSSISGLFYLSIFIKYKLSLSFLSNTLGLRYENVGGSHLLILDQAVRFFYKIVKSFGLISFFIIFFIFLNSLYKGKIGKIYSKFKTEWYLIFFNLGLFFLIPTKTSVISMCIIMTYLILIYFGKKKYLYLIIIFNMLNFFTVVDFLKINYRFDDPCKARQAISAEIGIYFSKGYLARYIWESENNLKCSYLEFPKKYAEPYFLQKKLIKNFD